MQKEKILVVEDELKIQELIRYHLEREQYQVLAAATGEEALRIAKHDLPELVLLDLMLPGMDGIETCRALRSDPRTRAAVIVMLTARTEEVDIVSSLAAGADDYITKPFQPRVLIARLRAILRRREAEAESGGDVLEIEDLRVDPEKHRVTLQGRPLRLTLTEFRILTHLVRRQGHVLSRPQILEVVQGAGAIVSERTIDVHVASLRKKLGSYEPRIETVRGIGYRFEDA